MSAITTQDGTIIVFDQEVGTVSASTESAARREIERRKAMKRERRV
ncbi:hypothetical protein [Mesorhizobium sp. B1-1-5]|nr:hypothetical protein [Mesorhizobium sp. B1-1-5]